MDHHQKQQQKKNDKDKDWMIYLKNVFHLDFMVNI